MYPKKLKEQLKNLSQVRTNLEDTGAEIDKIKANAEQMLKSNPHNRIYYFRTIYCQFMIHVGASHQKAEKLDSEHVG